VKVPVAVGVPLIVNTPAANEPETPAGKPETVPPAPPPPIEYVMFEIALLTHTVWLFVAAAEVRLIVALGLIVSVAVDEVPLQPPEAAIELVIVYVPAVLAVKFTWPVLELTNTSPAPDVNVPALAPAPNVGLGLALVEQ
jgi:hypothetical protein